MDQTSYGAIKKTLLIFPGYYGVVAGSGGTTTWAYDVTTGASRPLPGVTNAVTGIVRCSTLYYLELTPFVDTGVRVTDTVPGLPSVTYGYYRGAARLHFYDLLAHREVGSAFTLGDTIGVYQVAPGEIQLIVKPMGWDVTRDGWRLAYQQTHASITPSRVTLSSTILAANPDGSRPSPILAGLPPDPAGLLQDLESTKLGISPDGVMVAASGVGDSAFIPGTDRPIDTTTPSLYTGKMTGDTARPYIGHADVAFIGGLPAPV